jgi:hypothetical protein
MTFSALDAEKCGIAVGEISPGEYFKKLRLSQQLYYTITKDVVISELHDHVHTKILNVS